MLNSLRRLLAILTVYENNFRILHWMRGGDVFHKDHERLGDYYEQMGDFMDQIAEYLIAEGGTPCNTAEALNIISQDSVAFVQAESGRSYDGRTADEMSLVMFNQLYEATIDAIDKVQQSRHAKSLEDLLTTQSQYYYVEGFYKLGRRLGATVNNQAPQQPEVRQPMVISERPDEY